MCGLLRNIGFFASFMFAFVFVENAFSAEYAHGVPNNAGRNSRAGMSASMRMPTMPTLPINTLGNISQNINTVVSTTTTDKPGSPDAPDTPDEPDVPDVPDVPDEPDVPDVPAPECPDGGVKFSVYTVDNCMKDVMNCVNGGALPNGMQDLFNEDVRNSIFNGMNLCATQVDKCIASVRMNCENVYRVPADVWLDFNARKIQPEYYNFVLRKTGLTPYQAENTCLLLDRNTYGTSFNAVSANNNKVTSEYNVPVKAYNGQGGTKPNTQGVKINNKSGIDGGRGYYARWDATNAECYVRVGAYNKDAQIKNSWLFGAAGDDKIAETWMPVGSTFTCNKDLFGFSLYNDTSTVAVVGIGGGTLVGAGVGAAAGHGKRSFDCGVKDHRKKLLDQLIATEVLDTVNTKLSTHISVADNDITESQCLQIANLVDNSAVCVDKYYVKWKCEVSMADEYGNSTQDLFVINADSEDSYISQIENAKEKYSSDKAVLAALQACLQEATDWEDNINAEVVSKLRICARKSSIDAISACLHDSVTGAYDVECPDAKQFNKITIFRTLQDKNNRVQTALIGAGVGAGVGAAATVVTALVEKGNINCRVGDGLEKVSYGKSHNISSLRDFYVKWNLRLPDTIAPTTMVTNCNSWHRACAELNDARQCQSAQINYKPIGATATTLVYGACVRSGSVCIENAAVAKSYGACGSNDPVKPNNPDIVVMNNQNVDTGAVPDVSSSGSGTSEKQWYQTWNSPM